MDQKEPELCEPGNEGAPASEAPDGGAVASRFGALLAQGEARFEQGEYDEAIHLWTRILFLEREHGPARRAIERAKKAQRERQRVHDLQVLAALELLDEGRVDEARAKIATVVSQDPRHRDARQLADRLLALEPSPDTGQARRNVSGAPTPVAEDPDSATSPRGLVLRVPGAARATRDADRASPLKMAGFAVASALVLLSGAAFLYVNWESILSDGPFDSSRPLAMGGEAVRELAVPDVSELHYYNGMRLYDKGRYREALAELSRVERSSRVAAEARGLVLRIEERLLRGGPAVTTQSPSPNPDPNPR